MVLVGPGPLVDLRLVDPVLIGVLLALDLRVAQLLLGVGPHPLQGRHPIDDVDGQAEAVDLVLDGQVERGVDVALLLVAPHVEILVVRGSIGQAVDEPAIAVEVEDDRPVGGEQAVEVAVRQAVRMLAGRHQLVEATTLMNRIFRSWKCSRSSVTAASASLVGMSPALAITTSGSEPWSLLALFQMLRPLVQWPIASSMVKYCRCFCLSQTMTLT